MAIELSGVSEEDFLQPRIIVVGVGGGGCNAVNNMVDSGLRKVEFLAANTDAQSLRASRAGRKLQLGFETAKGLGSGAKPDIGRRAARESEQDIRDALDGCNMVFIAAGMGGGTGTGAAPVIAEIAQSMDILTVAVVTKPFDFEGPPRMVSALEGLAALQQHVGTLIIIPNQNLFRIANEKTSLTEAFKMADEVLCSGVRSITDLIMIDGLVNLDFADIRTVLSEMGHAMMGTGRAEGSGRALAAAEAAISNPLLQDMNMSGAKQVLINITSGRDVTLHEVDEAVNRIRKQSGEEAYVHFGAVTDESMDGIVQVSVVATGIAGSGQQSILALDSHASGTSAHSANDVESPSAATVAAIGAGADAVPSGSVASTMVGGGELSAAHASDAAVSSSEVGNFGALPARDTAFDDGRADARTVVNFDNVASVHESAGMASEHDNVASDGNDDSAETVSESANESFADANGGGTDNNDDSVADDAFIPPPPHNPSVGSMGGSMASVTHTEEAFAGSSASAGSGDYESESDTESDFGDDSGKNIFKMWRFGKASAAEGAATKESAAATDSDDASPGDSKPESDSKHGSDGKSGDDNSVLSPRSFMPDDESSEEKANDDNLLKIPAFLRR